MDKPTLISTFTTSNPSGYGLHSEREKKKSWTLNEESELDKVGREGDK